jgi:restriction system protein
MSHDVETAFDALLAALDHHREGVGAEVTSDLAADDYAAARAVVVRAEGLLRVRTELAELKAKWQALADGTVPVETSAPAPRPRRRNARGKLTPPAAYCRPLLEALAELGGEAPKSAILAKVGARLADVLTAEDHTRMSTGEPKWENRTAWARHYLTQEGLLAGKTKYGVWQITDEGRRWLAADKPLPASIPGAEQMEEGE